jgi:hypothetical protein
METTVKCPVPQITDALGISTATQPSPVHFKWGNDKVGIPRQLMHQLHRYDHSYPTGSYVGKMFLQGERLVWIRPDSFDPEKLVYAYIEYEETGEYDPNPHLEPCPLCHGEAYCGFEAKHSGDLVKFHITCAECDLAFGNLYKIGLELSIANSVLVMDQWNNRKSAKGGE